LLAQRQQQGELLSTAEQRTVDDIVEVWRHRLHDISWFMKCLNEPIARQANKEDHCTGHFWEARFRSQALLTETALLSCMAYVDLNPVRAAMADKPETSDHTSIKERISPRFDLITAIKHAAHYEPHITHFKHTIKPLLHFNGNDTHQPQAGIPFSFKEYLTLVDWTGRAIRDDKRGSIRQTLPPILQRLTIEKEQWLINSTQFEAQYPRQFQRRRKRIRQQ